MNNAIETETRNGLTISIYHDQDCDSPLEYSEGVFITYRKGARTGIGNTPLDQEAHDDIARRVDTGELIGLPVYCYQHSGIALNTTGFPCPWDSGQSGYIYVTRETALSWHMVKRVTAKTREKMLGSLRAIIAEYGQWCNGECYGYTLQDQAGNDLDNSCWGFIGGEHCLEQAREAADYEAKRIDTEAQAESAALASEARHCQTC